MVAAARVGGDLGGQVWHSHDQSVYAQSRDQLTNFENLGAGRSLRERRADVLAHPRR